MGVHKFAACRYCSDQIDVQYLARHETKCKTQTPEQREYSKKQRAVAREAYRASVRIPVATKKAARNGNDIRGATNACRYCHQQIAQGQMSRHEVACAKRTPEERTAASVIRGRQREYNRRNYQESLAVVAKRGVGRPPGSHSLWVNGNGKRLSATISIDFKSFREMLLQLAPLLSIDKVEVV